jgi:hypothetical protein
MKVLNGVVIDCVCSVDDVVEGQVRWNGKVLQHKKIRLYDWTFAAPILMGRVCQWD